MKKDIDKLLAHTKPKPQRSLPADFTNNIINNITDNPRPAGRFARIKEKLFMKATLHKPATAVLALAITLLICGTAYAAFNWPEISSYFRSEIRLPNGNRVVAIDTTNCNYFGKPNPKAPTKETIYYEIAAHASLTNDQAVDMLKGLCEEQRAETAVNTIIQPLLSRPKENIMAGSTLLIKKVDANKITTTADPKYSPQIRGTREITYPMDDETKAYDGTKPIRTTDIKAGDSVRLIARDHRAISSETDPADPNHWDEPEQLTLLAVIRVPALTTSPDAYFLHLGKDFVRTEPCATDPSGFCRAYDFTK